MSSPRPVPDSPISPWTTPRIGQSGFPLRDDARSGTSSGRVKLPRALTSGSVSSVGGALDPSLRDGQSSIFESGQNAISTLLQPPIVRTGLLPHTAATTSGAQRAPSSRDIPPVTLTNIPHVEASSFRSYLDQVGSLYDAFQRAKEERGDGASLLFRRDRSSRTHDDATNTPDRGPRKSQSHAPRPPSSRSNSASSMVATALEGSARRSSVGGGASRRQGHVATPLSTIPNVYFEQDFHLENPRTFDVVSERSDVVPPAPGTRPDEKGAANGSATAPESGGRKALATNAILQEKLSWYMDTVEVHLISSISTASTSFFAALGSLRELHGEAAQSVTKIKRLRQDLARLDQDMAVGGLRVVSMRRRRENLGQLGEAVDQLHRVADEVARCHGLVERGEGESALDGIEAVETLMAGGATVVSPTDGSQASAGLSTLRDLRNTKALNGVPDTLDLLRAQVGKTFEARFLETLLGDLRRHVADVPPQETLRRWGTTAQRWRGDPTRTASAPPAYMNLEDTVRARLSSHLRGLNRSHHTMPATTAYRDAVLREVKSLIRRHLPSSTEDDTESMTSVSTRGGRPLSQQEKSSILARNLRDLDADAAEDLFARIYSGASEAFRRVGVQVKVLLDVTSGLASPTAAGTPRSAARSTTTSPLDGYLAAGNAAALTSQAQAQLQEEMHRVLDMSSLLGQAVDIAHTQITKLLKVRSEQTARLSLSCFLRYFALNRLFADECEAVSGRGGSALKTVVNGHIKQFVAHLGETERQRLAQVMDADLWDAKDFAEAEQQVLSRIAAATTGDDEAWTRDTRVWESEETQVDEVNGVTTNGNGNGKEKVRSAVLDEQKFILPTSAMAVLRGVEQFEHLISGIPSMTPDVATNLLEYLKLFNSRSCQLILGAGATRSAGLKNITTKHLALASQALSFIIALTPYLREFVRRHAPSASGLMAEFDKVKRLYQEHQSGIHDKLVEIMSGRAATHVTAMRKIAWDDASAERPTVNAYMETLTKETSTLHRVLSKHLPDVSVQMIMTPVFHNYREQWGKAFQEAPLRTPSGKERMLRDVEHFQSRMSKLEGAGDLGTTLIGIVQDRVVVADDTAPVQEAVSAASPESKATITEVTETSSEPAATGTETDRREAPPTS
ncbi:MAG: Vacuolar protein sorting-associated protein 54 [Thelocarpon superellum]|nr:MAG: Vacuolar protein sorting-associated protein 54 [Thelocarpon superellum]